MITECSSPFLFLMCGQGLSVSELEQWGDELTKALQWPEPGESSVTQVSVLSSGVTSKAEHGFLLLQIQGGSDARSFTQWLGEAALQHDFVAIPSSDLFVLFLKRGAHEQAPQTMAGSPSLAALLAEARQRYEVLVQTLIPVTEAVRNLEQDYLPRGEAFWEDVTASLALVRQVVDACLALTDEKSCQLSVSDAIYSASMKEGVLLHHIRGRIGEVQLRLTAYQNRSSLAQRYLRQRQGVLEALRDLHRAGQDALKQSRVWRDAIQEDVYSSRVPSVTIPEGTARQRFGQRTDGTAIARKNHTANNSRTNIGTLLRLVTREEQREDELS